LLVNQSRDPYHGVSHNKIRGYKKDRATVLDRLIATTDDVQERQVP